MKNILKQLIEAQSTEDKGELASAEVISEAFARFGIESKIDVWDQKRANITAHIKSTGEKPGLLFACHIDVVGPGEAEWHTPPFEAIERDGKIYGRGSTDMKGGTAAAINAICQIVESGTELKGDIIFTAQAGEETDSCGAERFMKDTGWIPSLAGVIIPEPTNFEIVTAHRGMLWLKITTTGKAAHGSAPHLGINAIKSMKAVLDRLENYKIDFVPHHLLGNCSMSINTIAGGKAMNVVPDKCELGVDIRTVPGQDHHVIISDFKKILSDCKADDPKFEGKVSVARQVCSMETDNESDFVRQFCSAVEIDHTKAVGFTTDGPEFIPLGVPIVIFGPGHGELCHKPDEYIDIADLEKGSEYLQKIINSFLT